MEPPPGFPHGDTQVYVGFLLLQGETTILGSSAGHVGTFRVTLRLFLVQNFLCCTP